MTPNAAAAMDALIAVLCDPEGACCISGSAEDRAIVDRSLATLRQSLAQQQGEPCLEGACKLAEVMGRCRAGECDCPNPAAVDEAWQPIESAPKDGTRIALANAGNGITATAEWQHWIVGDKYGLWVSWPYIHGNPTHWQPLPAIASTAQCYCAHGYTCGPCDEPAALTQEGRNNV